MVAILKSVGATLVPVITENFYKLHAAAMTGRPRATWYDIGLQRQGQQER